MGVSDSLRPELGAELARLIRDEVHAAVSNLPNATAADRDPERLAPAPPAYEQASAAQPEREHSEHIRSDNAPILSNAGDGDAAAAAKTPEPRRKRTRFLLFILYLAGFAAPIIIPQTPAVKRADPLGLSMLAVVLEEVLLVWVVLVALGVTCIIQGATEGFGPTPTPPKDKGVKTSIWTHLWLILLPVLAYGCICGVLFAWASRADVRSRMQNVT